MQQYLIKQQDADLYWSGAYWGDISDAARYSKYGAKDQANRLVLMKPNLVLILTIAD
jgi:hypothetical protein